MAYPTFSSATLRARRVASDLDSNADGTAIASCPDSSSNSHPMVQATGTMQPLLKKASNGINGKSVLRFDATDDFMLEATSPNGYQVSYTRSIVARLRDVGGDNTLLGASRDYPGGITIRSSGADLQATYTGSSLLPLLPTGSLANNTAYIITVSYDGASAGDFNLYLNGTSIYNTLSAPGGAAQTGLGWCGESTGGGAYGVGMWDIAEDADFVGILSSGERAKLHSYYQDTYGITVSDYYTPGLSLTLTDTVGIADYGLNRAVGLVLNDLVGIADTANTAAIISKTFTDGVGITDSSSVGVSSGATLSLTVSDIVGIADSIQVSSRSVMDVVGIADQLLTQLISAGGVVVRGGNDAIMSDLIGRGYTTGTINDREYARLLAKTGASRVGNTIMDLYRIAGERPRL